jgi:hypothetical protein
MGVGMMVGGGESSRDYIAMPWVWTGTSDAAFQPGERVSSSPARRGPAIAIDGEHILRTSGSRTSESFGGLTAELVVKPYRFLWREQDEGVGPHCPRYTWPARLAAMLNAIRSGG